MSRDGESFTLTIPALKNRVIHQIEGKLCENVTQNILKTTTDPKLII